MNDDVAQVTLYEAEAAGVLRRAHGHANALKAALDEAAMVLSKTDGGDLERQLGKLRELERVVAARVELIGRRLMEGE